MFNIYKIIEEYVELYKYSDYANSKYIVLSADCTRDALIKMSLYEILYILRCRNILSTNQFRSIRGQLECKTDEVMTFIRNKLLEKYGETLLLNNKLKESYDKSHDGIFIYDRINKKLFKIDKVTAIDIRLGE